MHHEIGPQQEAGQTFMAETLLACAQSCDLHSAYAADCLARNCAFACDQVIDIIGM